MSFENWTDEQIEAEIRRSADGHTDCVPLLVEWMRRTLAHAKRLLL
jgi:hypothetical protein